jgi:regulator of protease activity HflC (stomatin/prohibitin superfamily)
MRSVIFAGSVVLGWMVSGCTYALVEPGHRGLLFNPDHGIKQEVLGPGNYHLNTFCFLKAACARMDDFDVTFSTHKEAVTVTSSEGLKMTANLAIIYRPIVSELYELDTEVGPNYYDEVLGPEFRSASTGVLTRHSYMELGAKNEKIEDEIEADVRRRITRKHVEVASIVIESVEYAPEIAEANRARIVGEQEAARQKAAIENEDQRRKQQLQHQREQAQMEVDMAKAQLAVSKAKDEQKIASAKAEAQATRYLAQAHADENRAQAQAVTPLTVQMHAYDALGKLGGEGTTVLLGEWSHVPNFLFPRGGAFVNAYPAPYNNTGVSQTPSTGAKPAGDTLVNTVPKR